MMMMIVQKARWEQSLQANSVHRLTFQVIRCGFGNYMIDKARWVSLQRTTGWHFKSYDVVKSEKRDHIISSNNQIKWKEKRNPNQEDKKKELTTTTIIMTMTHKRKKNIPSFPPNPPKPMSTLLLLYTRPAYTLLPDETFHFPSAPKFPSFFVNKNLPNKLPPPSFLLFMLAREEGDYFSK